MLSIREFRNNLKKYLDDVDNGVHVEVKRGQNVYTISAKKVNRVHGDVVTFIEKNKPAVSEYGCGYAKDGKPLCGKHGRV